MCGEWRSVESVWSEWGSVLGCGAPTQFPTSVPSRILTSANLPK